VLGGEERDHVATDESVIFNGRPDTAQVVYEGGVHDLPPGWILRFGPGGVGKPMEVYDPTPLPPPIKVLSLAAARSAMVELASELAASAAPTAVLGVRTGRLDLSALGVLAQDFSGRDQTLVVRLMLDRDG
jgi:hypothetical protein